MARIQREVLINHLKRISCGGLIKEAIFRDSFAADALQPSHLLLVVAPNLDGVDPLEGEIGIGDIKKVIAALGFIGGDGDETADVDVSIVNKRLVIDESARNARVSIVTANPKTIATRVSDETVQKLLDKIDAADAGSVTIAVGMLDDVQRVYAGLKADTVKLVLGPNGGFIKVGTENSDGAEFFSPALTAPQECTLHFDEHLIRVFEIVSGDVVLRLPGAGSTTIAIEDEGFIYLVSAKAQAAAGKPAIKKSAEDAAVPAAEVAKPKTRARRTAATPAAPAAA